MSGLTSALSHQTTRLILPLGNTAGMVLSFSIALQLLFCHFEYTSRWDVR